MADQRPNDPTPPLYVSPEAAAIAGEEDGPPKPAWPKVIGIISLVMGGLGALGTVCGVAALGFAPMLKRMAEQNGQPAPIMPSGPIFIAQLVIGVGLTILLIMAGIGSLARKPSARKQFLVYGFIAIISGAYGIYSQMQVNAANAAQNPGQPGAGFGQAIGLFCGSLGILWPLFLLIWFLFIKKNASDFRQGMAEQVA